MDVLAEIEPRVFRRVSEVMSAEHRDEKGKHKHHAGIARDEEGRFCGNLIDAQLMVRINEAFPRKMRERGWEVEDMDTTDYNRARTDSDYRAERKLKLRTDSLTVNEFALRDAQRRAAEAVEQAAKAEQAALDAELAAQAAVKERDAALTVAQNTREEVALMQDAFNDEMASRMRSYKNAKQSQDNRERELDLREQEIEAAVAERTEEERRKLYAQKAELDRRAAELDQAEATVEGGVPVADVVRATVDELGKVMEPETISFSGTQTRERAPFFASLRQVWSQFTKWLSHSFMRADGRSRSELDYVIMSVEKRVSPANDCTPIATSMSYDKQHDEMQFC